MPLANLDTPSTLFLAIYDNGSLMACTGALRDAGGEIVPDVVQHIATSAWATVDAVLADVAQVKAKHIILFTNCPFLTVALCGRVKTPPPASTEQVFEPRKGGKGFYATYPVGGDINWWNTIRHLERYWCAGGSWQVIKVGDDKLRKARELLAAERIANVG